MGDVISIFKNKKELISSASIINPNSEILKDGLLILGDNCQEVPFGRLGLEIFNQTSLWFFVNINDLSQEAFLSANSFNELGRMCIFIPDLSLVSLEKQKVIFESLLLFGEDSPKIIAVVHSPLTQLLQQGLVISSLVNQLKKVSIDTHHLKSDDGISIKEIAIQISQQVSLN